MKRGRTAQPANRPIVFLLDLDGTLQGNVSPQLNEYEFIKRLNKHIVGYPKIKYNFKTLALDFEHGLLRPHVEESLKSIKNNHPNVEFFIYTASSDPWANFIVPRVLRKVPSINSLFFSREFCSHDGKKSIKRVLPMIKDFLSSKYDTKSLQHVFLVDNNIVLEKNEMGKLIHCPTYDYTQTVDITRGISDFVRRMHHHYISNEIFGTTFSNEFLFMVEYYRALESELTNQNHKNKIELIDTYWIDFAKIVNSYDYLSSKTLQSVLGKLRHVRRK